MDNCKQSAKQLALIANAVAIALSDNFNADELNVIGNLIVQIGSTLLTIAAVTQSCESANAQNNAKNNPATGITDRYSKNR